MPIPGLENSSRRARSFLSVSDPAWFFRRISDEGFAVMELQFLTAKREPIGDFDWEIALNDFFWKIGSDSVKNLKERDGDEKHRLEETARGIMDWNRSVFIGAIFRLHSCGGERGRWSSERISTVWRGWRWLLRYGAAEEDQENSRKLDFFLFTFSP